MSPPAEMPGTGAEPLPDDERHAPERGPAQVLAITTLDLGRLDLSRIGHCVGYQADPHGLPLILEDLCVPADLAAMPASTIRSTSYSTYVDDPREPRPLLSSWPKWAPILWIQLGLALEHGDALRGLLEPDAGRLVYVGPGVTVMRDRWLVRDKRGLRSPTYDAFEAIQGFTMGNLASYVFSIDFPDAADAAEFQSLGRREGSTDPLLLARTEEGRRLLEHPDVQLRLSVLTAGGGAAPLVEGLERFGCSNFDPDACEALLRELVTRLLERPNSIESEPVSVPEPTDHWVPLAYEISRFF